jgi:hypothetical protein
VEERSRPIPVGSPGEGSVEDDRGGKQVETVRLQLGPESDGVVGDGQEGHRRLTGSGGADAAHGDREDAQRDKASEERQQAERPGGGPKQIEDEPLRPEEAEGADLAVGERPEQAGVVAVEKVDRDKRLVPPQWPVLSESEAPEKHAEHQEKQERPTG